ncbi:MAG TPA: amidohydrolase family protein [Chloroflexota bacterium]
MNIDVHWHYLPEAAIPLLDDWGRQFAAMPALARPELQIAEMDRRRIDLAAVSPMPGLFQYHLDKDDGLRLHRLVNDSIADLVAAYPDRYVGLATVPLQDAALAVQELERAMQVKGLRGVEICTHVAGRNLDDPALRPFFEAAAAMGAFVFVHPTAVLAPERLNRYYLTNLLGNPSETAVAIASVIFGGLYDANPALTCCFAHGGGTFCSLVGRWRHGYAVREEPHAFGARSPEEYLPRIYVDSLVHDDRICRFLIDTVGADHMMLGSDMPFDMGADDPVDRIERLDGISAEDKALILGGTASRLLRLHGAASA